jgi:hypothetical protein
MSTGKAPWHLWFIGILALLWNASGAYTILMAQAGKLTGLSLEEAAYYAAQPQWFVVVTEIALFGAIAAAIALLMRSRASLRTLSRMHRDRRAGAGVRAGDEKGPCPALIAARPS